MSLKSIILDGFGTGNKAKVNEEGCFEVVQHAHPPLTESVEVFPFRQYFTDNGLESGSNDMRVNGAANTQDFWVAASEEYDIYIKTISIEISDGGATLNEFGNLPALSNGVGFYWFNQKEALYTINESMKTNWELIRMCATSPYGGGGNAFKANNISGVSEGFTPIFDTARIFGMPWGLRLKKGSTDKLLFRINDNIQNVDSFNAIAYGTRL